MNKLPYKYSDHILSTFAENIQEYFYTPAFSNKTNIFLCGASLKNPNTVRSRLNNIFSLPHSTYLINYDIIYPEDLFDDLLLENKSNLLDLENLLADNVDIIIIILESQGAIAELGAFTNNPLLINKIICINDIKYRRSKSFISQGPIKLLKSNRPSSSIYIDFNKFALSMMSAPSILDLFFFKDKDFDKIMNSIKDIKISSKNPFDKINLLQLDKFILGALFLIGSIDFKTLSTLTEKVIADSKHAYNSTKSALSTLMKNKFIEPFDGEYKLTKYAKLQILNYNNNFANKFTYKQKMAMDECILEIMNLKYRNKNLNKKGAIPFSL